MFLVMKFGEEAGFSDHKSAHFFNVAKQVLREGGLHVQESATREQWTLYVAKAGRGGEKSLDAFVVFARLLGAIFIRFILEAEAFPAQLFKLLAEAYDVEDSSGLPVDTTG